MEIFSNLPFELQGLVLSHSRVTRRAIPAQLELFQSLPPDVQQKVYNDAFSSDDVYDSYNYRCKPSSGRCVLRFCLFGLFIISGSAEEYPPVPPARYVLEVQGEERSPAGAAQRTA